MLDGRLGPDKTVKTRSARMHGRVERLVFTPSEERVYVRVQSNC